MLQLSAQQPHFCLFLQRLSQAVRTGSAPMPALFAALPAPGTSDFLVYARGAAEGV